jgi:Uncharacterised nucleotidyltransferase
MLRSPFPIRIKTTPRSLELKEAVVACFTLDPGLALSRLTGFKPEDWLSILWWLDTSGIAIYFYHRACEIGADAMLPCEMGAGLAKRLRNNCDRMKSLFNEARAIAGWLESENVPHALLKGVTLTPDSVQESALRCQTDLDFLVSDRFADLAGCYIQRLGYRLQAKSGTTLEFRAGPLSRPDLANLYSVETQRALELHLAAETSCECRLLSRRVKREFDKSWIYALSTPDILVQQAVHLLKHLCSEHTRLSWVLEFWRHIRSRQGDGDFWPRAESCASEFTHADLAMGMAVWVAEDLFGSTGIGIPAQWRSDVLPVRVKLWLERYARQILLSDTIGNKLYAFLRREMPDGTREVRTTLQIFLPRVLPTAILEARPNETRSEKWRRYCVEARFVLWRLWFHLREGARFAIEVLRWNRTAAGVGR